MTGFVVTPEVAAAVLAGIEAAQTSRGLPVYWTTGAFPILSGEQIGKVFIPFDDEMAATNLRDGMTPMDFPETAELLALLGGMDARVEVAPEAIANPSPSIP